MPFRGFLAWLQRLPDLRAETGWWITNGVANVSGVTVVGSFSLWVPLPPLKLCSASTTLAAAPFIAPLQIIKANPSAPSPNPGSHRVRFCPYPDTPSNARSPFQEKNLRLLVQNLALSVEGPKCPCESSKMGKRKPT